MRTMLGRALSPGTAEPPVRPPWHDGPLPAQVQMLDRLTDGSIGPLHPLAADVVRAVAQTAHPRPNVATVARALGCSVRELERRFARAELPPPLRLVVLTRWLVVARSMGVPGATTRQSARQSGFASSQAFCRAVHREVHLSVTELRCPATQERLVRDLLTAYPR